MNRNLRTAMLSVLGICCMTGLGFASVPLYRIFCQVTGFGGTTQTAEQAPATTVDRLMQIQFDATVHPGLPWDFKPEQRQVTLKVGEPGLIYYSATNLGSYQTLGVATFNVTPEKAGQYFTKVACFCFQEQPLAPGETARLGVSFFVDPAIMGDPDLDDVTTITLSYTFFADPDQIPAVLPAAAATR